MKMFSYLGQTLKSALFFLLFLPGTIWAVPENEEMEEEIVFAVVETMPEFPGGQQALSLFLQENIKYPAVAKANGIYGRVICQFIIEKDGYVSNVEVIRSCGDSSLDKEALRVVSSMPPWKPGRQRGQIVRVKYSLPVNFKL